ncbi:MAG: hypothetical protein JW993_05565 [Sedimentisphaerales bacterium]|nr:hypothetical protein [Sedimentisphaerales bacterium]
MTASQREAAAPSGPAPAGGGPPPGPVQRVKEYFRKGFHDWIRELIEYRYLIALSVILVVVAAFLDYYSGVYVTAKGGTEVPDLILDRIEPIDLSPLFVYGYLVLVGALFAYPLFFHIRMFHAVLSQFSLLVVLRSIFMIFTHLETPADAVPAHFPWIFQGLSFQNDMFFSGHTAIPFLGFYLFKDSPVRYLFLVGSIVMAIVVLAMHMHYSIDVFSAFFITYCSYQMGTRAFDRLTP